MALNLGTAGLANVAISSQPIVQKAEDIATKQETVQNSTATTAGTVGAPTTKTIMVASTVARPQPAVASNVIRPPAPQQQPPAEVVVPPSATPEEQRQQYIDTVTEQLRRMSVAELEELRARMALEPLREGQRIGYELLLQELARRGGTDVTPSVPVEATPTPATRGISGKTIMIGAGVLLGLYFLLRGKRD